MAGSPKKISFDNSYSKNSVKYQNEVEDFLKTNPNFLNSYIQKHVSTETIQDWLAERSKVNRRQSATKWRFSYGNSPLGTNGTTLVNGGPGSSPSTASNATNGSIGAEKCALLKTLAFQLHRNPTEGNILWELTLCISNAVNASSFVLYLLDTETKSLKRFSQLNGSSQDPVYDTIPLNSEKCLATHVCKIREPQIMTKREIELKFGHSSVIESNNIKSYHLLCHPIIRSDGELLGVIELHRNDVLMPFYFEDLDIVNSYLVWGSIALHYANLNSVMHKQKKQNDFLLDIVRAIFQDMVSMDTLIKKIMNFAQTLVDADRASLFLLDQRTQELFARLFDTGNGSENTSYQSPQEIRFPVGKGIAGKVAATGEVLNIKEAYSDPRFNPDVDRITGYVTRSILCMPIFIRGSIIGVVQMVNKKLGTFNKEDEEAFQTFAVYCGLALHHAKLYDKIRRSEQRYNVALEVLSYYNTCSEEEFQFARKAGMPKENSATVVALYDFNFNPMPIEDLQKIHLAVYMFVDLFGLSKFDLDSIYRFFLTVKKNYRHIPYHNFNHGFTVAHCMYCILKRTEAFTHLERLCLYVGSLVHDLDHRGLNNKFMLDSCSPLAAIYSTSTMEHHHFNQAVTILQTNGHNIFSKLNSNEYKIILRNIRHCILATDLATFFPNKDRLLSMIKNKTFTWIETEPRLLAQCISMTAADLCASAKPWDIQLETVQVIFEEFYDQGDLEKRAGRTPIPMMDRDRVDEQPASQVGFISNICIPCYGLLGELIPETITLLDGCVTNLEKWRVMAKEHERQRNEK